MLCCTFQNDSKVDSTVPTKGNHSTGILVLCDVAKAIWQGKSLLEQIMSHIKEELAEPEKNWRYVHH